MADGNVLLRGQLQRGIVLSDHAEHLGAGLEAFHHDDADVVLRAVHQELRNRHLYPLDRLVHTRLLAVARRDIKDAPRASNRGLVAKSACQGPGLPMRAAKHLSGPAPQDPG